MFELEDLKRHIPSYLSDADQRALVRQLNEFSQQDYYTNRFADELLQGDGWTGVEILNFEDGQRDKVQGIVLSNSCDIEDVNKRAIPPRIVFAPLVPLDAFEQLLRKTITAERVDNKLDAIRHQKITSLFFLPRGGELEVEHIALLDDLHTVPLSAFKSEQKRVKLFTLSQMGFYLFVFKLSIHFCRFGEGVGRSSSTSDETVRTG